MFLPNLDESFQTPVQLITSVGRGNLNADSGLVLWNHGVAETYDIDALLKQVLRYGFCQAGIVEHDRDNGMNSGFEGKPGGAYCSSEVGGVFIKADFKLGAFIQDVENLEAGEDDNRRDGV